LEPVRPGEQSSASGIDGKHVSVAIKSEDSIWKAFENGRTRPSIALQAAQLIGDP
jgi:hypothetical protein